MFKLFTILNSLILHSTLNYCQFPFIPAIHGVQFDILGFKVCRLITSLTNVIIMMRNQPNNFSI